MIDSNFKPGEVTGWDLESVLPGEGDDMLCAQGETMNVVNG